jgi:putative ABC transport system permease protein
MATKMFMETLWQDVRYGLKTLGKSPGFTTVAVLALAIGIGANTAIFSVVNAVLIRPLPFREPDRLVRIWESNPERNAPLFSISAANYLDWREQCTSFERIEAYRREQPVAIAGDDGPEQVMSGRFSAGLPGVLGLAPQLGRSFVADEERPGSGAVAILGHGFWQRRFGGDPGVIGKPITLDGEPYTIVGVMPEGFVLPNNAAEVWTPLAFSGPELDRANRFLRVLARLKPGVPLEQATAELAAVAARLAEQHPDANRGWGVAVQGLQETVVDARVRRALLVLLGAVGFVLLIACANVANLLLARAAGRGREIAVREALGASRGRIVRQLLTESMLIALAGGALGLLLAAWGIDFLAALDPGTIPRVAEVDVDGRVLGFTLATSVLTGLAFGLFPALRASAQDLNTALKEGGQDRSGERGRGFRSTLVVLEAALALVLLIGAGLLARSFVRLQEVSLGFEPRGVTALQISLPKSRYPEAAQARDFVGRLIERVATLPGVTAAGAASTVPMFGGNTMTAFTVEGRPSQPGEYEAADFRVVTPGYLDTLGVPLLRGRGLTPADDEGAPPVLVINETFARRYWPGEDALGKRIAIRGVEGEPHTVVGVVGDVRELEAETEPRPTMYQPLMQFPAMRSMTVVARAEGEPEGLAAALREQVWAIDRDQPIASIASMEEIVGRSIAEPRFNALLLGLLAGVALLLALVGIAGVVAYGVARRTREIGVRMALGAHPDDVLRLVLVQGLRPVLAGVAIGLPAAYASSRVLSGLLFGVSPTDPWTYAGVAALLVAAAAVACWVPARRAARVDPVVALRTD